MKGKHEAGKGDTYRKLDYKKWSHNYDMIFKKDKKNDKDNATRTDKRRTNNRKNSR